jgi:hypothetical protein
MGAYRVSTLERADNDDRVSVTFLSFSAIWRIPPIDLQVQVDHIQIEFFGSSNDPRNLPPRAPNTSIRTLPAAVKRARRTAANPI